MMKGPMKWLCAALLLVSGSAGAQVYKCKGPDGKISFADQPCPGEAKRPDPAKPEAKAAPPATRAEILRRWELKEETLAGMERDCARGNAIACESVEIYQTKTPAQFVAPFVLELNKACQAGNKDACRGLAERQREIDRLRDSCRAGHGQSCRRLESFGL